MFLFDVCFDLDELARRNMHVHSHFSRCASGEMLLPDIVRAAERAGLTDIAVVDHSNLFKDVEVPAHNELLKAQRDALDTPVRVRIGSELSAWGVGKYSETPEVIRAMEYRLFAQNHYQMFYWEHPEEQTPRGYADHMLAVLTELFRTDFCDCVAHPIAPIKIRTLAEPARVLDCISDAALGDLLAAGEAAGSAWELHAGATLGFPAFARRFFNLGRELGVHFTFGTDAHSLAAIDPAPVLEQMKAVLA